ncbi:MAG: Crp/Fnr family transcriptional regulator [Methylococcaceae bacterium]|jgi:CRP/FNR family cyclic AMP-dependent transcriptional regulator
METADILKCNELFKDLEESELKLIADLTSKKTVAKNAIVLSEGDTSDSMYIIKEGQVNVTLANEDGDEFILSTLHPGDNFGELSLLDDDPRSANIIAIEKCEFIVLNKADFFRLLQQNPTISISVIKYLCRKIRAVTSCAQGLALQNVYERIVNYLYSVAVPAENGALVTPRLTQPDIARHVGAGREMVNKLLNALKKGRYLEIENKVIIIKKKLPRTY